MRVAPSRDAGGQLVEHAVGEEAGVHTVQGGGEPLGHAGEPGDDLGELLDHPPAPQFGGVVRDRLEPQHAFAFGVGLTGQPPEVQLEHSQVIGRCLDRGLDHSGTSSGAARTLRGAEDGAELGHVEPGAGPVHHGVERSAASDAPSAKIRLRLYSS